MKGKTVYIIAAIAIILAGIVYFVEKPLEKASAGKSTPDSLESIKRITLFKGVSSDDCSSIDISKFDGSSTATVTKIDDVWYANAERKYIASEDNIKRLFDTIEKVGEGEVYSNNPKNHIKFQVDKMTGTRVKFYDNSGNLLDDVFVGKMGSNYMSPTTYVRKADSDEVISVSGFMMNLFQTGEDSWRERTIMKIESDDITGFTIKAPGEKPLKLAKLASDEWTCLSPENIQIQKSIGTSMVNSFSRLRASEFVNDFPQKPYKDYGLVDDAWIIKASLRDYSSTPTLYIGKESIENKNQWYVKSEDQDTVHLIYKYNRDSLAKTLKDIKPTPTPIPTPKDIVEKIKKEAEEKRKEIEAMTEEEKKEAVQKKLDEMMKQKKEDE
jgi:uncharacterized protein DUF4340